MTRTSSTGPTTATLGKRPTGAPVAERGAAPRVPFTALLRAEWTKATSSRLLAGAVLAALVLSVGIAGLLGLAMGSREDYCATPGNTCVRGELRPPAVVVTAGVMGDGVPGAGLAAVMLLGALVLLVEHRFGTLATAFVVTPRRHRLLLAKAALVSAVGFVVTALATFASSVLFDALAGAAGQQVEVLSATNLGIVLRTALVGAVAAVLGLAVGALLAATIPAIAVLLLWPAVLETVLPSVLPRFGEQLAGWLPFVNARHLIGFDDPVPVPFSAWGSGAWFLGVTAVLFGLAVLRTARLVVR